MSDEEGTTMEINFRLDQDGRTARPIQGGADGSEEPPTAPPATTTNDRKMDYDTNVAFISRLLLPNNNNNNSHSELLDDLLLDCEISDCGLMPRTFWVPANAEPRFRLEQLALAVFRHHVGSGDEAVDFDTTTSGAEWWVQLRPSPEKTGRYAMHDHQDQTDDITNGKQDGDVQDMSKTGISFHWDKDEELRLLTDGTVNLHPHLSTVTYLTDWGCPTLVANFQVDSFTGAWVAPAQPQGVVAWPKQGKHLSFDGRFLHAAPPDLMEDGVFEQQCHVDEIDPNTLEINESEAKKERRRRRRATFLVNIWLNYRPVQVDPFPETMMDKMSRDAPDSTNTLDWGFIRSDKEADPFLRIDPNDIAASSDINIVRMTWPMGDCNSHESIEADIPLQVIQEAGRRGATVRMEWTTGSCHDNDEAGASMIDDDSFKRPGIGLYRGKSTGDHCNTAAGANGTATQDLEHDEDEQGLKRKRQVNPDD